MTTQGEMVVAKLFDRNGPSGWYSQAWISRADQSLSRQKPATWNAASLIGIERPCSLPLPIQMPSSSSRSIFALGPKVGMLCPGGRVWPWGRITSVPDGTMVEARPW
ncbi:hypothetical protein D9M71_611820 [compost metagenome]